MPQPKPAQQQAREIFRQAVSAAFDVGLTEADLFDMVWEANQAGAPADLFDYEAVCEGHSAELSPPPQLGTYDAVMDRWGCDLRPTSTPPRDQVAGLLEGLSPTGYAITYVPLGAGSIMLAVDDGRLIEITVENASALLSDHVLFHALPETARDEPF